MKFETTPMALFLMAKLFAVGVKEFTEILAAGATDQLYIAQAEDFPERAPRLPRTRLDIGAEKFVAAYGTKIGVVLRGVRGCDGSLVLQCKIQLIG
jgi:hypothetical protein